MNFPLVLLPAFFVQSLSHSLAPAPPFTERVNYLIDFGRIEIGASTSESVELVNWSTQQIQVFNIDISVDDAFQVNASDCDGTTLQNGGDFCQIKIQFKPEEPGKFSGEVSYETSFITLKRKFRFKGEAVKASF